MTLTPEFVLQLLIAIGASFGVYAAIKADLREALLTARKAETSAANAHERVDEHINIHHVKGTCQ